MEENIIAIIPVPFSIQPNQKIVDQMKLENRKIQIEKDREL